MIQELREYSQSFFFKLLLGIICVTFVVSFGVGSFFGDRKEVVAKVNDKEILLKDYREAYQNRLQSLRGQLGENADAFAEQINLRQRVFEQLVDQMLLIDEAEAMNLMTTDLELQEQIRNQAYFQKNGRFDYDTYNTILSQNRIVRQDYEDGLRREMLAGKLRDLFGSGLVIGKAEIDQNFRQEQERIMIDYLHFNPLAFLEKTRVTDEELRAHYDENKDSFKSQKQFRISYFTINVEHYKSKVKVREREIRRYYEKNLETYTTPPKVKARHILFKLDPNADDAALQERRAVLEGILAKIREGADFEELAKTHSEDATSEKGGDLGWFQPGEMVPQFEDAAFRLETGQVSEVVQSPFGLHLIRVDERADEVEKSLDEVREEITSILAERRAEKKLEEEVATMESEFPQRSLAETAVQSGLEVQISDWFDAGAVISGLGSASAMVKELEGKTVGFAGSWKRNPVQGHVLYELKEIREPAIRPFEDVETAVKEQLRNQKALVLASEAAQLAVTQSLPNTSLEELAELYGLEVKPLEFTAADRYLPELGDNTVFRSSALKLDENNPYALSESEERIDLLRFKKRILDLEDAESLKEQIQLKLLQRLQQAVLSKELQRLRNCATIEILNPVFQPLQTSNCTG